MKKIFLLFFMVLFLVPLALAVPASYKGVIDYTGDITTGHTIKAESASRTTTKTITESSFVINHLVKKGEIVKFYFDNNLFTEYTQPLPGTVVDLGTWKLGTAGITSDLFKAKSALTYTLILNGNPSKDNVIGNLYLPTSLAAYPGVTIGWSPNHASVANNGTVTRDNSDHEVTLTATLSKIGEDAITAAFAVTIKQKVAAIVPTDGKIDVPFDQPEIVINATTGNLVKNIEIPETVSANTVISLNLKEVMSGNNVTLGNNTLTLTRKTNSTVNYSAEIPASTVISGPADWNGLINLPTVKDTSEVTSDGTTDLVIEMGYANGQLNFSNAVKVVLSGMTGKQAGYTHGTTLSTITLGCASATDSSNIVGNGECYFDDGKDLILWTKHFTKFAAYTPSSDGGDGDDGGGGGGGGTGGGGGGGGAGPAPTPTPVPAAEEAAEAPAEEVPAAEEAPVVEAPAAQPSGLGAITGRAIEFIKNAAGKVKPWQAAVAVLIVLVAIGGYYGYTHASPTTPEAHYSRATELHRKAEDAYRSGNVEKSEALYKQAQEFREKGEKLQK